MFSPSKNVGCALDTISNQPDELVNDKLRLLALVPRSNYCSGTVCSKLGISVNPGLASIVDPGLALITFRTTGPRWTKH